MKLIRVHDKGKYALYTEVSFVSLEFKKLTC